MPDISDLQALTTEQRAILLDVGQFTLDVIGIVEPTPFADLTNGVVSLFRSDWLGAGLSVAGVLPYVGDLAKLGKIPKYLAKVECAIQIAKSDTRFAMLLRPVLEKLLWTLDWVPLDRVPQGVRNALAQLQTTIIDFHPGSQRGLTRLGRLREDMLQRVFGSTRNVGWQQRVNVRTAVEFFDKYNVSDGNPAEWAKLLKGIDLHAAKDEIRVVKFPAGELVAQYVELSREKNRQVGQWLVKAQGAVSHRNLGLSGAGRDPKVYRVRSEVEVLESRAASAADHWTKAGPKPHTAVIFEQGQWVIKDALQVSGGGTQFFLPRAREFLEEVPLAAK